MDKDKKEYLKDLEDVLQNLKIEVQHEENLNRKVMFILLQIFI